MSFNKLFNEAILYQESFNSRSLSRRDRHRVVPFENYDEADMIELQDWSQASSPAINTPVSPAGSISIQTRNNENGNGNRNDNRNSTRVEARTRSNSNNSSPDLFATVGNWISTSAATVVSVAQDLVDEADINIGETLNNLSNTAVRVAEESIGAGLTATEQAHSAIEGAIVSYFDLEQPGPSRNTRVTITGGCNGGSCREPCCASAHLMTDEDIERAVSQMHDVDDEERMEEARYYQTRPFCRF